MSFVYILTNESMPGYIKIGLTERPITDRVLELDNTSVPLPFQCYYAARVSDHKRVERALHTGFGDSRVRNSREFFTVDPFRVKAILELLAVEEVTPKQEVVATVEDSRAIEKAVKYGRRFSFSSVDIPVGAILNFAQNESITAVVNDDTSIIFDNQVMSLSAAALIATQRCGYRSTGISGPWYWLYQGATLDSIRSAKEASK